MRKLRRWLLLPSVGVELYRAEDDPTSPLSCDVFLEWAGFYINWCIYDVSLNWIDYVLVMTEDFRRQELAEIDPYDHPLSDHPKLEKFLKWHKRVFWWRWR